MSKKVIISFKDPDAIYEADLSEEERRHIIDEYSEFGEYFRMEVDFSGKSGRLLRRDDNGS